MKISSDVDKDKFLIRLSMNKDGMINPEISVLSKLRYPSFKKLFDLDDETALFRLEELEGAGLLKRVLWRTALACPSCRNLVLCVVLSCPSCGSTQVEVTNVVSCPVCKYRGGFEEFRSGRVFRCPRCGEHLSKKDIIREYKCENCNSLFSTPEKVYYCPVCKKTFSEASLEEKPIFSYRIADARLGEHISRRLKSVLNDVGGYVDVPGIVIGRSGVRHVFTGVVHSADEIALAVEVLMSDVYVGADHVLRSLIKVLDVSPKRFILIAIPRISPEARKILETNKVELIESSDLEEAVNGLELLVRKKS